MQTRSYLLLCYMLTAVALMTLAAEATQPPPPGVPWPTGDFARRILNAPATTEGFAPLVRRIQANRAAVASGQMTGVQALSKGGTVVRGQKSIPVFMVKFSDTAADPYPVANMQTQLFNGPWPTGTMTDFYREISYGQFTVTGTVYPWQQATQTNDYYSGSVTNNVPCNALCSGNKLGEMLKEALTVANRTVDFSQYDNDGPDGIPNSGDDDGIVDFVAFVHPVRGGECGTTAGQPINNNIWSHKFTLQASTGSEFLTNNLGRNGQPIRINNYVIMPALACDGRTMTPIGVFTHEFGHAFGLPDLYDAPAPTSWEGVGQWDVMGSGGWGGDGRKPERPSHMAAWSKSFLGWVDSRVITTDTQRVSLRPIERFPDAVQINLSADEYYLIEYRTKTGFDDSLVQPGVLIWKINDAVVQPGMLGNRVNGDKNNPGVYLLQADGLKDLDEPRNRGDAGDPFPGQLNNVAFGGTTNPASRGTIAICNISITSEGATFDVLTAAAQCGGPAVAAPVAPASDPSGRIFLRD